MGRLPAYTPEIGHALSSPLSGVIFTFVVHQKPAVGNVGVVKMKVEIQDKLPSSAPATFHLRTKLLGQVDDARLRHGALIDSTCVGGSHLAKATEGADANRVGQVLAGEAHGPKKKMK